MTSCFIFLIGKVIAEDFDLQYVLGDRFVSRWERRGRKLVTKKLPWWYTER
jgi:hypothetical protein